MTVSAASILREDSFLWDAIIVGSLLVLLIVLVAVVLDMRDGL